jgi:sialate O-acetylesterase
MKVEGGKVRLAFDHVGGGLVAKGDAKLKGFAIAGEDKEFVWADAVIDGKTVVVSSPDVARPAAVRYNWATNPIGNLFNKEGLPASCFRTDVE